MDDPFLTVYLSDSAEPVYWAKSTSPGLLAQVYCIARQLAIDPVCEAPGRLQGWP